MYTTIMKWAGGGGCLRGLSFYFHSFQHFLYSERCSSNDRSKKINIRNKGGHKQGGGVPSPPPPPPPLLAKKKKKIKKWAFFMVHPCIVQRPC